MSPFRRTAYLLATISVLASVISLVWKPAPPPAFVGISSGEVPTQLGAFHSLGDYQMPPEVQAALSSADIVARSYSDARPEDHDPQPIDFVLIGGTDRSALHDPRSCLVGGGWKLEADHIEPLPGTSVDVRSCHAVSGPEGDGYDILYLYVVDGAVRNKVTEIRAEMLVSAVLGRKNRPVYFLRFMQPLNANPAQRDADHQRLVSLAAETWKTLSPRLEKGS